MTIAEKATTKFCISLTADLQQCPCALGLGADCTLPAYLQESAGIYVLRNKIQALHNPRDTSRLYTPSTPTKFEWRHLHA